jgi:hypothetical protein
MGGQQVVIEFLPHLAQFLKAFSFDLQNVFFQLHILVFEVCDDAF